MEFASTARELKQSLIDFVYEAEGELAVALETYAAEHARGDRYDPRAQELTLDQFITRGRVGDKAPWEIFLATKEDLSENDRAWISNLPRSFTGLFEVIAGRDNRGFELKNWLSDKSYLVLPDPNLKGSEVMNWEAGEIVLTRLMPLDETWWMVTGACIPKGKLGKPKLAVAVGEFKKHHRDSLYGDAPELLARAWLSVARFHQQFLEYFGQEHLTLPGYQLERKLGELQQKLTEERLTAAGIDSSKSVRELAREQDIDEAELEEAIAASNPAEAATIRQALDLQLTTAMRVPKVNLPDEIKKAEAVTAFSHPRWGQIFLPSYPKFQTLLAKEDPTQEPNCQPLVQNYLEAETKNYFIWQQLRQENPEKLQQVLRFVLERPDFDIQQDLEALMEEYNKPLQPELPDTASVPQHLYDLFEAAIAQTKKLQTKSKKKAKPKAKGFG